MSRVIAGTLTAMRRSSRFTTSSVSRLTLFALVTACAGTWAQSTHVLIAPLHVASPSGQAEVGEAVRCANRCEPIGGSDIIITVDHRAHRATYEALLAIGSCEQPGNQTLVARFPEVNDERIHVDIPIATLTSGKYVLIIRQTNAPTASAGCGLIKRG